MHSPITSSQELPQATYIHILQDAEADEQSIIEDSEETLRLPPESLPMTDIVSPGHKTAIVRGIALLCICWLSVGSHYGSYILGPLKSRLSRELGTSHSEFSLLLAAYSLNSTWTPLVGGLLAARLGTTVTSILATGVLLFGQVLLLVGNIIGSIRIMTLGMFIFGLGVSPLAVVQETIIVRFFKSHGLGVSMAIGLLAGKGASFIAAWTSYPLTTHFGRLAPFYVAAALGAVSFTINLVYIAASKWLIAESGALLEAPDIREEAGRQRSGHHITEAEALERVAEKKRINVKQISRLGDVFWLYVTLNVFCGMIWHPFTHLAANIIEKRYDLPESKASNQASYLLVGSVFLYPVVGFIVDRLKKRPIIIILLFTSSILTFLSYCWFDLPPSKTGTAWPGIALYAVGQGFAPLLLVVIVPQIVAIKYVSTALGIHKSLEQAGSVISQTLAGLVLDFHPKDRPKGLNMQFLMNAFVFFNVLQFFSILAMWLLQRHRKRQVQLEEQQGLLNNEHQGESRLRETEIRRGKVFMAVSLLLVLASWALFFTTAWSRLAKPNH